jgi:hypothetical protein
MDDTFNFAIQLAELLDYGSLIGQIRFHACLVPVSIDGQNNWQVNDF